MSRQGNIFFLGNMTGPGKEKRSGGTTVDQSIFILCALNDNVTGKVGRVFNT